MDSTEQVNLRVGVSEQVIIKNHLTYAVDNLATQCNKANKVLAKVEYPERLSRTTSDNDIYLRHVPKGEMKQSNSGRLKKKRPEIKSKSNSKSQRN